jgi:hypothetical protein
MTGRGGADGVGVPTGPEHLTRARLVGRPSARLQEAREAFASLVAADEPEVACRFDVEVLLETRGTPR